MYGIQCHVFLPFLKASIFVNSFIHFFLSGYMFDSLYEETFFPNKTCGLKRKKILFWALGWGRGYFLFFFFFHELVLIEQGGQIKK